MNVDNKCDRRIHPKETANFLSKLTFLYNLKLFWRTYKSGTFREQELFEVLHGCRAKQAGNELEHYLREDLKNYGSISLLRVLWKCYGIRYLILGLIQLVARSILIITISMSLSKVILYFQPGQEELRKIDAIWYATLLILLNFFSNTYIHNYLLVLSEFGIKIRTAFCSAIYRKSLRLTSRSLTNVGTGKIVTLITKDVTAIETFIFYCNDVWVGVLQAIIVFYLIFSRMGIATLVGMGFFVIVMPIQVLVGKITSKLRLASSKNTDERLQVTKETLTGISTIKMNTWEDVFKENINENRKKEMATVLKIFLTKTVVLLIGNLTSKIAYYLLLTVYVLTGNIISAELIYYVTMLFQRIRFALNVAIPVGVTVIADTMASLKRIEALMMADEVSQKDLKDTSETKPRVSLADVTIEVENKEVLKNISLSFDQKLTIVTGSTGSGKTTLLKSILGECETKTGVVLKEGRISYSPQEAWIFPATLKQNIVFDEHYDENRYQKVLDACALNFDIQQLSLANDFNVGDNGANLSKGQKARINLARAIYKKADIYLIDDCLTSLDTNVQKQVFQKCIREFLADKICIFVMQNLQYVQEYDKLVLLEDGKLIFSQKISENKELDLTAILKEENKNENLLPIENNTISEQDDLIPEDFPLIKNVNHEGRKLYEENKKSGKVDLKTYGRYIHYGGGLLILSIIIIFLLATQFSESYTEKILSIWVNTIPQNASEEHGSGTATKSDYFVLLYSMFILATTVLSIASAFFMFNFCRNASLKLHRYSLAAVIHATMGFFDQHLIGNILTRFSKDLSIIDEDIPFAMYEFQKIVLNFCGAVILISMVDVLFIVPTGILCIILYIIRKMYMPISRNLQRLDVSTKSPIIGYLNSSLEGSTTIRAFQAENTLSNEFDRHQDLHTSANYTSKCCQRAFGYYLDVCCTMFVGAVIATFIIFDTDTSVGDIGLAITQASTLTGVVQFGIRQWTEIESKMTSVERILEYADIKKEENSLKPYGQWPKENSIKYKNVMFSYRSDQDYVLRDINLMVNSGEKVGIVGRTGSGKSTIISLLFRLYDYQGTIRIGDQDIQHIPLRTLRGNISTIAQDPIIFTGTIRKNLDPLGNYSDEEIWIAMRTVKLDVLISSLDLKLTESGSNFSAGQRQLICLARCILNKNKIIILDEATSDMDQESEDLINDVLQKYFADSTVIIVAHRLKTILNCDKIFVIQEGRVVEQGSVSVLVNDESSLFYSMLKKSGNLQYI